MSGKAVHIIFYFVLIKLLFIYPTGIMAQNQVHEFPVNYEINYRIEKVLNQEKLFFPDIKPINNKFFKKTDSINEFLYVQSKPRLRSSLFQNHLIESKQQYHSIFVSPILSLAPAYSTDSSELLTNFRIGFSCIGSFGDKLGFRLNGFYGIRSYAEFYESQVDKVQSMPHFGSYLSNQNGKFQYMHFSGYLNYSPFEFLHLNLGKGSNFWGNGYRSLFLSNNSANYPYIKLGLDVWRINYLFLVNFLSDKRAIGQTSQLSTKMQFAHYLSYNVSSWLNLGFFESLIFNPKDSLGITYINPAYFNPAIFLRPVEFASGSADNALLGLSFRVKLLKRYFFYSQILIDEFVLAEMKSNKGWWGNKFGIQSGIKIFDPFHIQNLLLRFEYNQVRPYTYSHESSFLNYGNQFQAIAHPMGANFREIIFESHYHRGRYSFHFVTIAGQIGMDSDSISYGQDIYKPNLNRVSDYNIKQGQGLGKKYADIRLKVGWILNYKMNVSLFAAAQYQNYFRYPVTFQTIFFSMGISSLLFNDELEYFR